MYVFELIVHFRTHFRILINCQKLQVQRYDNVGCFDINVRKSINT